MSVPRLSGDYAQELSAREAAAERQLQRATETADALQSEAAHRVLDGIEAVRDGARRAGVSLRSLSSIRDQQSSSQATLGLYERHPDRIGRVGLADVETFLDSSGDADVSEKVEATLRHEIEGHLKSHLRARQRGVAGQVNQVFGEEDALALDEAVAMSKENSQALSDKPSEYREYDRRASQLAHRLGLSRGRLLELFSRGEEDTIAEAA